MLPPDHGGRPGAAPTRAVPAASGAVLVGLLGEVALGRDGELSAVAGARARLLIAALALHPGRSRSAQSLIDDVWGDRPPRAPMNALHTQVSRLRATLPDGVLEIGPAGYRLILDEDRVDLTLARRWERAAREAHAAGDDAACLTLIGRARALWRGDPGADLPAGTVADALVELAETRWRALDELELSAREAAGDLAGAVTVARRVAATEPRDESAHGTLMRLLVALGRNNEALEVFAALRARLAAELGTDPGAALVAMNTAILRGQPLGGTSPVVSVQASADGHRTPHHRPRGNGSASHVSANHDAVEQNSNAEQIEEPARTGGIGLRAAPNPLLGRDQDLAALTEWVRRSRVTTVLGPGGTGKTRVANELGLRTAREHAVVLVELASLRADPGDPDGTCTDIESVISAVLGVGEIGRDGTAARRARAMDNRRRLRDALNARPVLLILDNCEHVVDAVARVVADLVGACDQLTVLTTSRAPLAITAEVVYPLPPLAIDAHGSPATELFATRARAVRPSVRLDPQTVARLCHTLDGLPLAIELAAARVRTMSVEEIETRLEHRFALLRSGDRSSPERHRTLHAVIEWSWNLLDEPQRITLRRLCRFPAGFTLAAAEAVAAGPEVGEVAAAVDGLVSQSLLTVLEEDPEIGAVRYRMLETVREFGEEQLAAAAEADLVMDRICRWARVFALDAARRYLSPEQLPVVLSVLAEVENLLTAVRYALDRRDRVTVYTVFPLVCALWALRGAHAELIAWIDRVMVLPPPPVTEPVYGELQMLGTVLMGAHLLFSRKPGREAAILRMRTRRLLRSGAPLSAAGRYAGELVCIRLDVYTIGRKLEQGARSPDPSTRAGALMLRANLRENAGDVRGSLRDSQRVGQIETFGHIWGDAMLSQHMGQLAGQSGRYRDAVGLYQQAVQALSRLRAYDESIEMRSYLAIAMIGAGEYEQADKQLEICGRFVEDGVGPDDPVLRPNHRRAAVMAGWSELALVRGETEIGLRRARSILELLDWPCGTAGTGPGDILQAAAVLGAHVLYGRTDLVPDLPRNLIEVTLDRMSQIFDLPQIGLVAIAIGSYLIATGGDSESGWALLALAERVGARQDIPSSNLARHLELHRATTDSALALARQAAAVRGRRRSAERILELLRHILPDLRE